MTFKPTIGWDGFKVTSTFDIDEVTCTDLNNDIYQLAIIVYPPEVINEKFMIKLRDCVLKLPESHPVKRWMKFVAASKPVSAKELKKKTFLLEIIGSQFNLITDAKVKNEIIKILHHVPDNTVPEKLLRSYLYLMIGNITRSDNILREIIAAAPRVNWERTGLRSSMYHKIASEQAQQILAKLSRHPADRRSFELFGLYLQSFYNEESVLKMADDIDTSEVESKIGLKFIEGLAPSFVKYLRLSNKSDTNRIKSLRNLKRYPLDEQSYWDWAFFDIDPLVSDAMNPELERLEKEDQLWFIYLMDNEKLADQFNKKSGKSFLPSRRPFLKESLNDHHAFMMSLYKLIELGDINPELVIKTADQILHE